MRSRQVNLKGGFTSIEETLKKFDSQFPILYLGF